MCSIIGYSGQLNVAPLLVDSLKQMEYRGYDSAGVAIVNNGKVLVSKGIGSVSSVAYKFAEGIVAGELKHGPLALIDKKTYVIVINPEGRTHSDNLDSAHEIKTRGATIIGISNKPDQAYDIFLSIPSIRWNIFYPIIEVLPLQLLAYHLALIKSIDPDYPRNLAKSVTVK
jgi:glucosamine--fructose-6-phosphate aminotransferase (isomerizing)